MSGSDKEISAEKPRVSLASTVEAERQLELARLNYNDPLAYKSHLFNAVVSLLGSVKALESHLK